MRSVSTLLSAVSSPEEVPQGDERGGPEEHEPYRHTRYQQLDDSHVYPFVSLQALQ